MKYQKLSFAALVTLLTATALRAQSYTLIDLGTLGGTFSSGFGINNAGQVTGTSASAEGHTRGFLYSDGHMTDLGTLGGATHMDGRGINNAGQVTGSAFTAAEGTARAFLYSDGNMTDLGTLRGATYTGGFGINNAGQVTGFSSTSAGGTARAFLYSNGSMTDLGTLGGTSSEGYGINNAGQVTGYSLTTGDSARHAFLYTNGSMTDLGTLGGSFSEGSGINDAGQVTGYSNITGDSAFRAFLYSNGSMTDLGTLGGNSSAALAINNAGQVTGTSSKGGAEFYPFLYSDGTMSDLASMIAPGSGVTDIHLNQFGNHINDWGQIVGDGRVDGEIRAVLLNPINPNQSTSGDSHNAKIVEGMAFSKVTRHTGKGGFSTTAMLLDGTATANRDVTITINESAETGLASDVVDITGTGSDVFVLELSYDGNTAVALYGSEVAVELGWFDPDTNTWKNAVAGNTGGTPTFAGDRAYNSATDFVLGTYGVDTTANTVWAVINHNSDFAAVPEPSTYALLGVAGAFLVLFRRRKVA